MPREIVLFIPGTSGSYLRDSRTGTLNWGLPLYLLGWRDYYPMQMPYHEGMEDFATHGPVLDRIWISRKLNLSIPFYSRVLEVLQEQAKRRLGDHLAPSQDADLYSWPYDWRQSLVHTAQRLDETVQSLIDFYQDPDLKISLVCHSHGCLGGVIGGPMVRGTSAAGAIPRLLTSHGGGIWGDWSKWALPTRAR